LSFKNVCADCVDEPRSNNIEPGSEFGKFHLAGLAVALIEDILLVYPESRLIASCGQTEEIFSLVSEVDASGTATASAWLRKKKSSPRTDLGYISPSTS
jgi:hypothetical protein